MLWMTVTEVVHTKRMLSFLTLLAMASNCESWLNRSEVIVVVRLPMVLSGFGRSPLVPWVALLP